MLFVYRVLLLADLLVGFKGFDQQLFHVLFALIARQILLVRKELVQRFRHKPFEPTSFIPAAEGFPCHAFFLEDLLDRNAGVVPWFVNKIKGIVAVGKLERVARVQLEIGGDRKPELTAGTRLRAARALMSRDKRASE